MSLSPDVAFEKSKGVESRVDDVNVGEFETVEEKSIVVVEGKLPFML